MVHGTTSVHESFSLQKHIPLIALITWLEGFSCVVGELGTQVTLHGNRTQVVIPEGRLRPKGR